MSDYHFRSIMAVLWLIAANVTTVPHLQLGGALMFAVFSIGLLMAAPKRAKGKANG